MFRYKIILWELSLCILFTLFSYPLYAGTYPSSLNISYGRSFHPQTMKVKPGIPVTITLTITNNEASAIRGFYLSEQIHKDFAVETVSIRKNDEAISDYKKETGIENAVYGDHIPHYWIVETGPEFEENNPIESGDILEIIYTVTSQKEGIYRMNQEGVFGITGTLGTAFFSFDDVEKNLEVTNSTDIDLADPVITGFELLKAYPNPFNSHVVIELLMGEAHNMTITIISVKGEMIRILKNDYFPAGKHVIAWDGRDQFNRQVASGIYFCQLLGGGRVIETVKLINTR